MRKIPFKYDNPFDNYIIELADLFVPYAYQIGANPNMITTLSNIACIITILLLLNSKYYLASFFLLISYFFDCADGHMARKYNMTSVFGDYYDHISDVIKIFAIFITLYYIDSNKFLKIIPIIILLFVLMSVHMGCQELLYDTDESITLEITKYLCPVSNINNKDLIKDTLNSTKYFGCGTFNIAIVIFIIYYSF